MLYFVGCAGMRVQAARSHIPTHSSDDLSEEARVTVPSFRHLKPRTDDFAGLDTFPAPPAVTVVRMVSDEVTALCPITGQPDWYEVAITYRPDQSCIESKSLKLYFQTFRNEGIF